MVRQKAQVVFEFIIASVFFLGLVFYVLSYIDVNALAFGNDAAQNDLESKAFRIAETLVSPSGLQASRFPLLDAAKLAQLQDDCPPGDSSLLPRFDLVSRRFGSYHLQILAFVGTERILNCGQEAPPGVKSATARRAGLLTNTGVVTVLAVTVW